MLQETKDFNRHALRALLLKAIALVWCHEPCCACCQILVIIDLRVQRPAIASDSFGQSHPKNLPRWFPDYLFLAFSRKKQGFSISSEPLKSQEKKGKTLKKTRNSLKDKKARNQTKNKEKKRSGLFLTSESHFHFLRFFFQLRKLLVSVKLFVRNSGAGNGCANFMDAWKNASVLQEKQCP